MATKNNRHFCSVVITIFYVPEVPARPDLPSCPSCRACRADPADLETKNVCEIETEYAR